MALVAGDPFVQAHVRCNDEFSHSVLLRILPPSYHRTRGCAPRAGSPSGLKAESSFMHDADGLRSQLQAARRHLAEFGLAAP
jgi:hypothetical protein